MSLTTYLKESKSPIHHLLCKEWFKNTKAISKRFCEQINDTICIKPNWDESKGNYDYSLLGMAFDYRFRYFFSDTPRVNLAATFGASKMSYGPIAFRKIDNDSCISIPYVGKDHQALQSRLITDFFDYMENHIDKCKPFRNHLDPKDENVLNNCCLVLGHFESAHRNQLFEFSTSRFARLYGSTNFQDLFTLHDESYIEDLYNLSQIAYEMYQKRLNSERIVLNPTFEGSKDIGGADADLILNNTLIEIKTVLDAKKNPGYMLRQLVGYTLLDYNDKYQLHEIEVFFPRQKSIVRFTINEVIENMTGNDSIDLPSLRNEFRSALKKVAIS